MKINEVFIKALEEGSFKNLSFMRNSLARPNKLNDHINIEDGKFIIKIGDTIETVKADTSKSLFDIREEIVLPKGCMSIVKNDIKTTYGRAIVNYILLEYGLEGKIDYIDDEISMGNLKSDFIIPNVLSRDLPVSVYKKVINASTFLRSLADIVVVASSEKMVFPPKGLKEFKKTTAKIFEDKHGKDWIKDNKLVLDYESKLEEYYKDYLKDDPVYGITLDDKMFKSIKSRQISIGILDSIDPDADNAAIMTSLYEGLPFDDPDALSTIFNNIVYGSFSRSELTQIGGVISKILTRATHNYKIDKEDCGVSYGLKMIGDESLLGRYLMSGKLITSDNLNSVIGKEVEIRSLAFCKEEGEHFCKICAGDTLGSSENNILLVTLSIGGAILKHYLSKFHAVHRKIVTIDKRMLF